MVDTHYLARGNICHYLLINMGRKKKLNLE